MNDSEPTPLTIRKCRGCGCLVAGGPTACVRCAELKPCPFCGATADFVSYDNGYRFYATCKNNACMVRSSTSTRSNYNTQAEAITAWNTRAASTMKAWEWSEGDGASVVWCCLDFQAFVYSDCGLWRAYVDCRSVGNFAKLDTGKAACVAYVEHKLKEWLV